MSGTNSNLELYDAYLSKLGYSSFDNLKKRFEEDKSHLEKEILPLIPKKFDSKILELASGTGALLSLLSDRGYLNFIGVDIGEEQVSIAKKLGVNGIKREDAMISLKEANDLDVVLALDLIEHFNKREAIQLIKRAYEALAPGGKLILRCPNADSAGGRYFLSGDLTHELPLNSSSFSQLLRAGGFTSIAIQSSYINTHNPLKEIIRKPIYFLLKLRKRINFFANGLSSSDLIMSPNLIAVAMKD